MRSGFLAAFAGLLAAAPALAQPAPLAATLTDPDRPVNVAAPASDITADVLTAPAVARPRAWASADYLLWWITPSNSPDLIVSVPSDIAANQRNNLPAGATTRVFPQYRTLDLGRHNGVRFNAGVDFDGFGIHGSGFWLENKTEGLSVYNNGTPAAVGLGFTGANSGQPTVLFLSLPNLYSGGASVVADRQAYGAELNLTRPTFAFLTDYSDLLLGFRYFDLSESITRLGQADLPNAVRLDVLDIIRTQNRFYGGQVGIHGRAGAVERGLGLDLTTKLGLGGVRQEVEVTGANQFTPTLGGPDRENLGLFARPFNQGTFARDKFAVAIDLNLNLTYNFTRNLQVFTGYSLFYLSSVVRPGEAVDSVINEARVRFLTNPVPGNVDRPVFTWRANDVWVQGISFGAKLQF
jgi:hypothetical protein